MKTYSEFSPSRLDPSGLGLPDRQDWLVLPTTRNRDSGCLAESNFEYALAQVGGEGADVELHRLGHWACGWFEIVIVRPETEAAKRAEEIANALDTYPILNESDYSERMTEAARQTWRDCYTDKQRLEYIRRHGYQFHFHDLHDLLGCVRGRYFSGDASELIDG